MAEKRKYQLKIKQFDRNEIGRDFVVGDIHGWFPVLEKQLREVGFDKEKDRLFALGDLIDRGPQSWRCIEYLDYPWFHSIMGNHEEMMYEYHNNIAWFNSYARHGGQWFIDSPADLQQKYVDRLDALDHIFEIDTINGKCGLVHAEVPCNDWDMFKLYFDRYGEAALWSFDLFDAFKKDKKKEWTDPLIKGIDFVVHGHAGVPYPVFFENQIYIDTGADTKRLTLLEINNPAGLIAHHLPIEDGK